MSATPITPGEETVVPRARALPIFDPLLLLAAVGLVVCSCETLKGATSHAIAGHPLYYVQRQALFGGIGLLLAVILSRIDYSRLREFKYALFGIMVALNLVVYAMPPIQNARRWIPLPFLQFQSSEFGKVLLIVALAGFAVDRARRIHEWRTTVRIMLLAIVAALLVIPQPDLGTGMVYVAVGFSILFFAGTSFKQITALVTMFVVAIAIVLAGAPAAGVHVLKGYQVQRLTAFLHPNGCPKPTPQNPIDPCYQLQQSQIAIGSGQKTGRGNNATQTKLNFLPANDTDFVFAAVGETYGFVGAVVVLSLYALLIWRALRILTMSKNLFGTLIAAGILAMLMFQIFVNVGMTIGIMPITGVPLPLLSYGGSSVIVTFIAVGLLQSIYIQARMAASGKARTLIS
ncbi:MAG TPA: FtsW/RodA/SpoVE family cell cycle protein [Solirubrobacteraceae bacterium]|nr:FtsW/RodA/SpoVE family cell cycle protein [Solirubrobacteraceae bacterium]